MQLSTASVPSHPRCSYLYHPLHPTLTYFPVCSPLHIHSIHGLALLYLFIPPHLSSIHSCLSLYSDLVYFCFCLPLYFPSSSFLCNAPPLHSTSSLPYPLTSFPFTTLTYLHSIVPPSFSPTVFRDFFSLHRCSESFNRGTRDF